jgi:hypothetical protein
MSLALDPENPVAGRFYRRAGIHPLHAPEPPKSEPCKHKQAWKEDEPPASPTRFRPTPTAPPTRTQGDQHRSGFDSGITQGEKRQ